MLNTVPDRTTVQAQFIGSGLPYARIDDAQPAPINPEWASQFMLAAHRIPMIDPNTPLMSEAFQDTRFPHQPARKTLTDSIRLLASAGSLNAEQARWLADNRTHPNRLWSAIGTLSAKAVTDPNREVIRSLTDNLLDRLPMRDIARFVTGWARALPETADVHLIAELHRALVDDKTDRDVDWGSLTTGLTNACGSIVEALNARLEPDLTLHGEPLSLAPTFYRYVSVDSPLCMDVDMMHGVMMSFDPLEMQDDYWKAMVMGLRLVQANLFPCDLPEDILDRNAMMYEESDEDLDAVAAYLLDNDLDDSPENIEAALESIEPLYVDCFETWEELSNQRNACEEIKSNWRFPIETSIPTFCKLIDDLNECDDQLHKRALNWLTNAASTLSRYAGEADWSEQMMPMLSQENMGTPECLREYSPVYCESDMAVEAHLEDRHQYFMQGGGEEDSRISFSWTANPADLLALIDKMNAGYRLIAGVVFISDSEE